MTTFLGKIGELSLKGSNIKTFENQLLNNTRQYLKSTEAKIALRAGRLYITCEEKDEEAVEYALSHLLGITGWAKTVTTEKNIEAIQECVKTLALQAVQEGKKTFKIEAKRQDKTFPLNSYEIACEGAKLVYDENIMDVDVHKPDITFYVEVRDKVYIYSDSKKALRGLPVGTSNKGLLLLSGGLDSPVAGYRMARRGMKIECCYFHSYPYTSIEAQQKVEELAAKLSGYSITTYLNIVPFTDVQMKIKEKAPEEWSTLMLRVCMMKVANMLCYRVHSDCIITGESLGQVASQTLENMSVTEHFAEYPLLRPLCGMDKEEIIRDAVLIDTYNTSILPYEDCCVLFSPKHPVLRGRIEDAERIYKEMDIDSLIQEAFEKRDVKHFFCGKEIKAE